MSTSDGETLPQMVERLLVGWAREANARAEAAEARVTELERRCFDLKASTEKARAERDEALRKARGYVEEPSAKQHKHTFTGLYTHFGPYRSDYRAVHYHVCVDTGCDRVLIGKGRECGLDHDHWRETLTAPKEECAAPGNCPQAGCPLCDPQGALAPKGDG